MSSAFIHLDRKIISFFKTINIPLTRLALFVIYFWFGFLKVVGASPADPLVQNLLSKTLPTVAFAQFIIFLGLLEMIVGVLFIIPRLERIVIIIFFVHMVATFLPAILLMSIAWQGPFIPTLEGQYIIKNIALIALAVNLGSQVKPRAI